MYFFIKRTFDLFISFIGILVLSPLFLIVSIIIKIEDGGPVFYKAERIGKNSKKIHMLKFRSMKVNAPDIRNSDGSTFNSKKDSRVTKIGRILRASSIDELPQLFNVFAGSMSLIGPRASTWDVLDTYTDEEKDKMKVRPGITGYTQAYYRNSITAQEKRKYDAWYANNVSFALDFKIFFKTIKTVFKKENVYTNTEDKEK